MFSYTKLFSKMKLIHLILTILYISDECFGKLYNRPIDLDEDYSKDEGIGNTFEEGESCKKLPSSLKKTINEVFMDSKCDKLVEVLVDLISNSDNLEFVPTKVRVKRCGGMCKTQMSCIPTNSRDIMVPVRRRDKNTGELTCGHITVEEHTRCGCRCTLMAKHCSSIQTYDANMCKCLCMDKELMPKCVAEGKKWLEGDCSCVCREVKNCSNGEIWDHVKCRCQPDEINEVKIK